MSSFRGLPWNNKTHKLDQLSIEYHPSPSLSQARPTWLTLLRPSAARCDAPPPVASTGATNHARGTAGGPGVRWRCERRDQTRPSADAFAGTMVGQACSHTDDGP